MIREARRARFILANYGMCSQLPEALKARRLALHGAG